MNKKGLISLGQLTGIVLLLVLIGIFLVVSIRIDSGIRDNMDTSTRSLSFVNWTTQTINTTGGYVIENVSGTTLVNPVNYRNCALTVTNAYNTTGSGFETLLQSGNYTTGNCLLTFASASTNDSLYYNNHSWNVSGSYSYSSNTEVYNASGDVIEGKDNIAQNQGLLGTIIIFSIIISVVVIGFSVRGGIGF